MRRVMLLLAGAVLAGMLVRAPNAWACSCVQVSVRDHVRNADAVFVGLSTSVEQDPNGVGLARFAIDEVYKGAPLDEGVLRTLPRGDSCAVEFVPGGRYVVFADLEAGLLRERACSGTSDDVGVLKRAGFTPFAPGTPQPLASAPPPTLTPRELATIENPGRAGVIGAAALFLAAAGLASFLVRGRAGHPRGRPV